MSKDKYFSGKAKKLDAEVCWQALLSRDKELDGSFVYAVRSTGIYCRPSCKSKLPRREQVAFYSLPEAAEQAGFRPCLRCEPQRLEYLDPLVRLVQQVCNIIQKHDFNMPLTLADLGKRIHMSPHYLQKAFKKLMGITPKQYVDACRLKRLKESINEGKDVTGALYNAGYSSSSRLYEKAPSRLGMTPGSYLRGGRGMQIAFTITDSPLGRLLVAVTNRGVCSASLGDEDAALIKDLYKEYPEAGIRRDEEYLGKTVETFFNFLSGWQPHLDLPIDLQVTAFQWRVYEQLLAIPYGSTRNYEEIAKAISEPKAVRAVARAVAGNPAAILIPCHRVIRKNGSLGGYRWGIKRKENLLELEKKISSGREIE
ncbi:MAG: bifunctional DNA-binding transcriptional regulator/O6-methylguanine-DNA methyltransferase Ada [Bacillota bacterium]